MPVRWQAAGEPAAVEGLAGDRFPHPLPVLLAQRGLTDPEAAHRFLHPRCEHLTPAGPIPGMAAAVGRLHELAAGGGRIQVVGDYDVDGVTATALVAVALRAVGAEVRTVLPRRDRDGYGLQPGHVEAAAAWGADALVAVDSGTSARPAWEAARVRALELVIVDHHLPAAPAADPSAPLLVNPRLAGSPTPQSDLTAAGLALHLAAGLFEAVGREVPWDSLLRLACLGTVADVAPLLGENRIVTALGLAALPATRSPGLRALMAVAGVRPPVRASDVAFRLAPRLNAAGRLASADLALELLTTGEPARGQELANELDRLNRERQKIENRILDDARSRIADAASAAVATAWSPDWHRGVVGIAAARLARELHRPVILLAVEGETATGSGRSAAGLPLHELLAPSAGEMIRFGGHAQAVGMTVRSDRLEALRELWSRAGEPWLDQIGSRTLRYDLALDPERVDEALLDLVESLEPFGAGNEQPVFRIGPLFRTGSERRFGRGHLAFQAVADGGARELPVVAWKRGEKTPEAPVDRFEMLAAVERDRYRGLSLRMIDARTGLRPGSD